MVGMVQWIPTLYEFAVLAIAGFCYILPGILLGDLLFRQRRKLWRISIGSSIIFVYYIFIGFVLSSLSLIIEQIYVLLWSVTLVIIGIPWILKRRDSYPFKIENISKRFGIFLFAVLSFLFFTYFAWEGKNFGIGAWDRTEHIVKLLYLVYHNTIPETEIGMLTNAFYPQGFNLNIFMFYSFIHVINPQIGVDIIIVGYLAANLAAIVIPIAVLASEYESDIRLVQLAIICYIPGSYLLIFESMPSTLAMFLLGNLILLSVTKRQQKIFYPIKILLLFGIMTIHLVIFLYACIVLLGIILARLDNPKKMILEFLITTTLVIISGLLYLALLYFTEISLLHGTIEYAFGLQFAPLSSNLPVGQFNLFSLLPTRLFGFIFYLIAIIAIVPVFLIGIYRIVQKRQWTLVGILSASLYISLAEFARFNNRVRFFMLYPVAIVSAIGMLFLIEKLKTLEWNESSPVLRPKQAASLVVTLIVLSSTFTCVSFASAGYGNATSSWAGRDYAFFDSGVYYCAGWMHLFGFNDIGIIATPNDAVYYQGIESLTNNKILMASTWDSPQSFVDIRLFFNDTTDSVVIQDIVSNYDIDAFLVKGNDTSIEHILALYPSTRVYHIPYDYVFCVLQS